MRSPDELDPDEVNERWNDLTAQLGDLSGRREVRQPTASGPRDYLVDDDDDEGFEPPVPEPHPVALRTLVGWLLLVVGIGGVLAVALTDMNRLVALLSAAAAIGGLAVLVTGLPVHRDPDDDGAAV